MGRTSPTPHVGVDGRLRPKQYRLHGRHDLERGHLTAVTCSVATDVGRVRRSNEDSVVARLPIFAVADGMGGYAGGEVASRIAIEELSTLSSKSELSRDDVAAAIMSANKRIVEFSGEEEYANAGTTVTGMAVVTDAGVEHWLVFNVGDSRVYRWASGELSQITIDHSEVQELLAGGLLDASDIRTHESRNVVTRALGSDPAPEVDWWLLPVAPGERFVICSDGLSVELSDDEIRDALGGGPVEDVAAKLIGRALAAGGRDNVTAIALEVGGVSTVDDVDEDTRPRAAVRAAE
jgi:PPM family protein phosphatase